MLDRYNNVQRTVQRWEDIGFRIEITQDQSPSLRMLQSVTDKYQDGEAMHHSGGAAAETDLIYGTCIREVLQAIPQPHFVIVGLGLGYIEMFIAKEALLHKASVGEIQSFESVPELRDFFWRWIHDLDLAPELQKVYDEVLHYVLNGAPVSREAVKAFLQVQFPRRDSFLGSLTTETTFKVKSHGLLYDAFSSKTTPTLWEEDFLMNFLQTAASDKAWLATYACKGSLKRALRRSGFQLDVLLGFQNKRYRISAKRSSPVVF